MPWICKECGSNNDDSISECEVCGCTEKFVPIAPAPSTSSSSTARVLLTPAKAALLPISGGVVSIPKPYNIIGAHAFEGNLAITTVIMHDDMFGIYKQAFKNCKNLKNVIFSGVLDTIGPEAFYNCDLSSRPAAKSVDGSAFSKDGATRTTSRSSSSTSSFTKTSSTSRVTPPPSSSSRPSYTSTSFTPPTSSTSSPSYTSTSTSRPAYTSTSTSRPSYTSTSTSRPAYTSTTTSRPSSSGSSSYFATRMAASTARRKKVLKILIPTIIFLALVVTMIALGITTFGFEVPQWVSVMCILGMLGIVGYSFIGYKNLNWSMIFTLFLCVSAFVNAVMGYTYVFDYLLGAIVNGGIIALGAMAYSVTLIKRGKKAGGIAAILTSVVSALTAVLYATSMENLYGTGMNILFTLVTVGILGAFILLISDMPRGRAPVYGKHKTRVGQIIISSLAVVSIGCTWGLKGVLDPILSLALHAFLALCGVIYTLIQHFNRTYRDDQLKIFSTLFVGANLLWILLTLEIGAFADPQVHVWVLSVILGIVVFYLLSSINSLVGLYSGLKHTFTAVALIPLGIIHLALFLVYPFVYWKFMIGITALSALYVLIYGQKILDDTMPSAENMIYLLGAFYAVLTIVVPVGMSHGFLNIAMEGIFGLLVAMLASVLLWALGEYWYIELLKRRYYPQLVGLSLFAIVNLVLWALGFYSVFVFPTALAFLLFSVIEIKMTSKASFTVGVFWSIALTVINAITLILSILSFVGIIGG